MITFLRVRDFAIIDDLHVEFGEGFNVVTGETGAGKSIIINALSALVGQKSAGDMVRTNVQQAEITGHFVSEADDFILKRIISAAGRSRAFLDDDPVNLTRLEELGAKVLTIYGQHDLHHLLDREGYAGIIDDLLGLSDERKVLAGKVEQLRKVKAELESVRKEKDVRENEIALLAFQMEEISRDGPREGEEDEVRERLKVLKDAERIEASLNVIRQGLDEDEHSAHAAVARIVGMVKPLSHLRSIAVLREKLESIGYDIEETVRMTHDIEKDLAFDAEEVAVLDDRLNRINQLKSKYSGTVEGIWLYLEEAKKRFDYLSAVSGDMRSLETEERTLGGEVIGLAEQLTERRKQGIPGIEERIREELKFLSMRNVRFAVTIGDKGRIDEEGKDAIEFVIATNPGEPAKPLRKIASGGELSRIMLAIKSIGGDNEGQTMIFDEIDAGIGGRVADMVGRRLKMLAKKNQIICITHLPQIAAFGDCHFLVEKTQTPTAAKTYIRRLSPEERIGEIARMIGGETLTEKGRQRAEEMLEHAQESTH